MVSLTACNHIANNYLPINLFYESVPRWQDLKISEPCESGKYRSIGMTSCEECNEGKIPDSAQITCGGSHKQIHLRLE